VKPTAYGLQPARAALDIPAFPHSGIPAFRHWRGSPLAGVPKAQGGQRSRMPKAGYSVFGTSEVPKAGQRSRMTKAGCSVFGTSEGPRPDNEAA